MKNPPIILLILCIAIFIGIWILDQKSDRGAAYSMEEGQLIFRMVDYRDSDYPLDEGLEVFGRLVEERSNGQIKILTYDEDALGNEVDIVEQIAFGGIDFARVSSIYMIDYVSEMNTLLMPGMFENEEEMMAVFHDDQINTLLKDAYRNEKINVLAWYPGATRGIFHQEADVKALEGEKIGVPECQMKIIEIGAMGFLPVPETSHNVNSYLKADYIEGAEGDLLDYYYHRNYLKASHFTLTPWSMIPEAIIVSNTAMKKLTVEQQKIIQEAANEAALHIAELTNKKEKEIKENLLNNGVVFHDGAALVDDNDLLQWKDFENGDNAELINLIEDVVVKR